MKLENLKVNNNILILNALNLKSFSKEKFSFINFLNLESFKIKENINSFINFLSKSNLINFKNNEIFLNKNFDLKLLNNQDFINKIMGELQSLFYLDLESVKNFFNSLKISQIDHKDFNMSLEEIILDLSKVINFASPFSYKEQNTVSFKNENDNKERENTLFIEVNSYLNNNFKKRTDEINDKNKNTIILKNNLNESTQYPVKNKVSFDNLMTNFTKDNLSQAFKMDDVTSIKDLNLNSLKLQNEWNLKIKDNIVEKARVILKSNDSGEIKLLLRPKELGSIRINIFMDNLSNNVYGRVIVDNDIIKNIFEQNLFGLNKTLNESGFNSKLELSLAGENSDSSFSNHEERRERGSLDKNINLLEDNIDFSSDFVVALVNLSI